MQEEKIIQRILCGCVDPNNEEEKNTSTGFLWVPNQILRVWYMLNYELCFLEFCGKHHCFNCLRLQNFEFNINTLNLYPIKGGWCIIHYNTMTWICHCWEILVYIYYICTINSSWRLSMQEIWPWIYFSVLKITNILKFEIAPWSYVLSKCDKKKGQNKRDKYILDNM